MFATVFLVVIILLVLAGIVFHYFPHDYILVKGKGADDMPKIELTPPNAQMLDRMLKIDEKIKETPKLKVCSLSLFRPETRNQRQKEYKDGILRYLKDFSEVFPFRERWILRIYYDDSLFTADYNYKIEEGPSKDQILKGDGTEAAYWEELFTELIKHENVQLAKFSCLDFQPKPGRLAYSTNAGKIHQGYFGTIARFFSIFDPDVELSIFRDADSNVILPDKNSIDYWAKEPQLAHAYMRPSHIRPHHRCMWDPWLTKKLREKYTTKKIDIMKKSAEPNEYKDAIELYKASGQLLAGMWACKYVGSIDNPNQWWNAIYHGLHSDVVAKCTPDFAYGIDEVLLNTTIKDLIGARLLRQTIFGLGEIYNYDNRYEQGVGPYELDPTLDKEILERADVEKIYRLEDERKFAEMVRDVIITHWESPGRKEHPYLKNYELPNDTLIIWEHMLSIISNGKSR